MIGLSALLCGVLFGFGLALSGMTDTAKVTGFLDLFGDWVPDLAFVMGGAVAITLIAFRFILRRNGPLLATSFALPSAHGVDARLLLGATIFGIGWGLYGYCPGPAIASLAYLDWQAVLFVVSMILGMWLAGKTRREVLSPVLQGP